MGCVGKLIEEQSATRRETVTHKLSLGTGLCSARQTCKRHPERGVPTLQQGNRRRAHRRSRLCTAIRGARRNEPRPSTLPGKALGVEPGRLILRDAGRKDLRLPRACRRLKAFETGERRRQCIRSLQSRFFRYLLPCKQEAEEVPRSDGLDLGAQALDRIMVDAGKQPAVAPLLVIESLNKSSAQNGALDLQCRKRALECRRFKPERRRQPGLRHRAEAFQPSAQDFDQRLLLRPHRLRLIQRGRNVRLAPCLWPYGVELVQALGRNPERSLGSFHVRGAFLLCQR